MYTVNFSTIHFLMLIHLPLGAQYYLYLYNNNKLGYSDFKGFGYFQVPGKNILSKVSKVTPFRSH